MALSREGSPEPGCCYRAWEFFTFAYNSAGLARERSWPNGVVRDGVVREGVLSAAPGSGSAAGGAGQGLSAAPGPVAQHSPEEAGGRWESANWEWLSSTTRLVSALLSTRKRLQVATNSGTDQRIGQSMRWPP